MAQAERRKEIDVLRVAAILLILAAHLPSYLSAPDLGAKEPYLVIPGLSVFVFISGLALDLGRRRVRTGREILDFVRRRILRIYPLYVPALLAFIGLFHYAGLHHRADFDPVLQKAVIHLLGAQVLAAPRVTPLFTLWFIGAVVMYYFVYIFVARFLPTIPRALAGAALLLVPLAAVRLLAGLIDDRFFFYYPFFIAGIVASRADLFAPGRRLLKPGLATAGLLGALALALWVTRRFVGGGEASAWPGVVLSLGGRFVFGALAVCVLTTLALAWGRVVSPRAHGVVLFGSVASYAVYLFHRPVLALLTVFLREVLHTPELALALVVVLVGVPVVFVLGHGLQRLQDTVMRTRA
jgi:peptidoglycan/LPS O-acetylase OafA/YrhL